MLDKMKELLALKKQAKQIQKELCKIKVEVERQEGKIKLVLNGEGKVEEIYLDPSLEIKDLGKELKEAFNEGIGKVQREAAFKMGGMGGFNLPQAS